MKAFGGRRGYISRGKNKVRICKYVRLVNNDKPRSYLVLEEGGCHCILCDMIFSSLVRGIPMFWLAWGGVDLPRGFNSASLSFTIEQVLGFSSHILHVSGLVHLPVTEASSSAWSLWNHNFLVCKASLEYQASNPGILHYFIVQVSCPYTNFLLHIKRAPARR